MPAALARWSAQPTRPASATILPDGCRDLICVERSGQAPRWFLSPLQGSARSVPMAPGNRLTGFRLPAGTRVKARLLSATGRGAPEFGRIEDLIRAHTDLSRNTAQALACLAQANSVGGAARELGVSPRSLQRLLGRETGRSPGFWHQLARIRRAARLAQAEGLAGAAHAAGFADQAHMNRAFQRWFGLSPARFCARPELVAQVFSRAYG